jgi:hypothetical protein
MVKPRSFRISLAIDSHSRKRVIGYLNMTTFRKLPTSRPKMRQIVISIVELLWRTEIILFIYYFSQRDSIQTLIKGPTFKKRLNNRSKLKDWQIHCYNKATNQNT